MTQYCRFLIGHYNVAIVGLKRYTIALLIYISYVLLFVIIARYYSAGVLLSI